MIKPNFNFSGCHSGGFHCHSRGFYCHSRAGGNPVATKIPAFAGMTIIFAGMTMCFLLSLAIILPVKAEEATSTEQNTTIEPETTAETPTTTIHAQINYLGQIIFAGDVSPTSTWFYDTDGILYQNPDISAMGALATAGRQDNFNLEIVNSWGFYVSAIKDIKAKGFDGWIYNVNMADPGWTAMNDYKIKNGDQLTIFYSLWPWKLESDVATSTVGEKIIFTAYNYSNDIWLASPSTTISVNQTLLNTNLNGEVEYTSMATGTINAFVYGTAEWPANSPSLTIEIYDPVPTSTEKTEESVATTTEENPPVDDNPPANNGGGGGGSSSPSYYNLNIAKAMAFLDSKKGDGSFGGDLYADWAALAYAASGQTNDELKNYLLADTAPTGGMNDVSNYARRAMALMSQGINPYNGAGTDYIKKITDAFDGSQFGDKDLYNDDIFALFPLLKSGIATDDARISSAVNFIISKQNPNGAWDGVDLTAASIQALTSTNNIEGADAAMEKAKNWLRQQQKTDGSFDTNSMSTAWAAQAGYALGEGGSDWVKKAQNYLYNEQNPNDGGLNGADANTRLWATAEAIPAALGKSWTQILNSFAKPDTENNTGGGSGGYYTDALPTSTSMIATSTIVTSTLDLPTITPTSTVEIVTSSATAVLGEKITARAAPLATRAKIVHSQQPIANSLKPLTNNLTIQQFNNEKTATSTEPIVSSSQPITDNLTKHSTAKKVAMLTGGGALAVGLYLGFRLLKGVV